jgi:hypothetical protein
MEASFDRDRLRAEERLPCLRNGIEWLTNIRRDLAFAALSILAHSWLNLSHVGRDMREGIDGLLKVAR